jgi:hypothetical protein
MKPTARRFHYERAEIFMLNVLHKVLRRGRTLPVEGFVFDRPIVVLQSDDWGRVGVRDRAGWDELRESGINLGERNYDFYSLETAEDLEESISVLNRHRDSTGRPACLGMNFITANIDFAKVKADNFQQIHLRPLTEGLPDGWNRPGLFEVYKKGISAGVFSPALHGTTHFCRPAAERRLSDRGDQGNLLRTLWKAGVPYIHWRMPWIGFEYSDPGKNGREVFLGSEFQEEMIACAVKTFTELFAATPRSACAPGYRANKNTHHAWANHGIQVAQNGPGSSLPPHFVTNNSNALLNPILHLHRTMDFEPSAAPEFSIDQCLRLAESSFARGIPAIVSVHSINFHSTLRDFRSRTLRLLDQFLTALESKYTDLLYVRDQDLYDLVNQGVFESMQSRVKVQVTKRMFIAAAVAGTGRA